MFFADSDTTNHLGRRHLQTAVRCGRPQGMLETPSARAALSVLTPKPFGQAPSPNGGSLVVDKNVLLGNAFSRDLFWVGVRSNKVNPFDWALGFVNN